jgi:hypothetical protein
MSSDRFYFRQLLSGRDFAARDAIAQQMVNFTYAIGDRANAMILGFFEEAIARNGTRDRHHRTAEFDCEHGAEAGQVLALHEVLMVEAALRWRGIEPHDEGVSEVLERASCEGVDQRLHPRSFREREVLGDGLWPRCLWELRADASEIVQADLAWLACDEGVAIDDADVAAALRQRVAAELFELSRQFLAQEGPLGRAVVVRGGGVERVDSVLHELPSCGANEAA